MTLLKLGTKAAVFRPVAVGLEDLYPQSESIRAGRANGCVALVAMPFHTAARPSIQLGLLDAVAQKCGFSSRTFHLALDAKAAIGADLYESIAEFAGVRLGDWLFSVAAFGEAAPDPGNRFLDEFAAKLRRFENVGGTAERFLELRWKTLPALVDRLLADTPWDQYRVVGFTSTFEQTVASYALARRIKQHFPKVTTLVGGANLDGEMGIEVMRSMPAFDLAVTGEADRAFPELLIALDEGRPPGEVQGVLWRRGGELVPSSAQAPIENMDELPTPNYDEFFERGEALGVVPRCARLDRGIPFETARGCWWGAKHHCTFCGLNGSTMRFRAKSAERVRNELGELVRRYRNYRLFAVDNIVDFSYLKTLFPRLVTEGTDYELFYEVKSNLTRGQLKLLADAGVRTIQPGIESMSSHVLALMRKGVTGIQNVNLLRWCRYYDISVFWAVIWGFPGEREEDAAFQAALFANLTHLEPPKGVNRICLERFSPLFSDRDTFPAHFVRPEASYAYAYPEGVDLSKLAYFFDYALENTPEDVWYDGVRKAVDAWHVRSAASEEPQLTFRSSPGLVQILDTRCHGDALSYHLEGDAAAIYLACSNEPRTMHQIAAYMGSTASEQDIGEWLEEFCAQGLTMRDGEKFLSLALPWCKGR
ncbi:MAG: RiPP maturation radical SAM C-methyltransferase [Polyangiaceae bacterium]